MAFVVGAGQTPAVRWANMLELRTCLNGVVNAPAGIIEFGIDYTVCPHAIINSQTRYLPIDATASVTTITINGADPGMSAVLGRDGELLPNPPTTTFVFYLGRPGTPTVYSDDVYIIYLRSEVLRTRQTQISNINIICDQIPDPAVFPYMGHGTRESDTVFVRETCTNDSTPVVGRNLTQFNNVIVPSFCGLVGIAETSSGAYSHFKFVDCEIRGYIGGLFMFGAGGNAGQPGKLLTCYRTRFTAVYLQAPGPEIEGQGGNGIYIHVTWGIDIDFCEFGTEAGGTAEWIPERGLYMNGGGTGFSGVVTVTNTIFWPNCYQGCQLGSGRLEDGTQGSVEVANCQLLSYWRAIDNDDAATLIHDCEIGGGEVFGFYNPPEANKIGYGLTVEDCTLNLSYVMPPVEYRGGATQVMTPGGQATFRRCAWTISAGYYPLQSAAFQNLVVEDCTFTATNAAAFHFLLVPQNGRVTFLRVTGSGTIGPFRLARVDYYLIQDCVFLACTSTVRTTFDLVGYNYRGTVINTTLPNLAYTVTGTDPQSWALVPVDGAGTVASAATISLTPNADRITVTGSTTISTINVKAANANILYDQCYCALRVGIGASWAFSAAGNITPLNTNPRVPGAIVILQYDVGTTKWVEVPDTLGPSFDGVQSADPESISEILVGWNAARDLGCETAQIQYLVYIATVSAGQDYNSPVATVTGLTSVVIGGLLENTYYFIVVRARDTFGNTDSNITQVLGLTESDDPPPPPVDTTPPNFAGISGLVAQGIQAVVASWTAATDNFTPPNLIEYLIYIATTSGGQNYGADPSAIVVGMTDVNVGALLPDTEYFVVVRARDEAGNVNTNTVELSVRTAAIPVPHVPVPVAGQMLVARMQIQLGFGDTVIDTGVQQANLGVSPDVNGATSVSRVMVEVLPPIDNWVNITVHEPVLSPQTGTVHVVFTNSGAPTTINVLIWDPATVLGAALDDRYE